MLNSIILQQLNKVETHNLQSQGHPEPVQLNTEILLEYLNYRLIQGKEKEFRVQDQEAAKCLSREILTRTMSLQK